MHSICRCARWHAGQLLPSKEEASLLETLRAAWVQHHGPTQVLYTDGGSGLVNEAAKADLRSSGIRLEARTRPFGQHARFIERRGAVLRTTMHVLEDKREREGITIAFPSLFAESIFNGNAVARVGDVTPHQAVYGRPPAVLPELRLAGDEGYAAGDGEELGGRREKRIR